MSRLLLMASLVVAACSAQGHVDVGVTSSSVAQTPSSSGTTTAAHLDVTVNAIRVHDDEDGKQETTDKETTEDEAHGWLTVFTGSQPLDLYDTVGTEAFIGGIDVPPGKINSIRLVLAGDPTLTVGDQVTPVSCPSCTESGLKIDFDDQKLQLAAGDAIQLDVDFDQAASLKTRSDGSLELDPVIQIDDKSK